MYRGLCVLCPGDKPLFQEPGRFLSVPETPTVSFGKHPRTPEVAVADYISICSNTWSDATTTNAV